MLLSKISLSKLSYYGFSLTVYNVERQWVIIFNAYSSPPPHNLNPNQFVFLDHLIGLKISYDKKIYDIRTYLGMLRVGVTIQTSRIHLNSELRLIS